jgi:hypothetical protein
MQSSRSQPAPDQVRVNIQHWYFPQCFFNELDG